MNQNACFNEEKSSDFFKEGGFFMNNIKKNKGDIATLFVQHIKPNVLALVKQEMDERAEKLFKEIDRPNLPAPQRWTIISMEKKLDEDFIIYFADELDWWEMSQHQVLSEHIIEKFSDRLGWENIWKYQPMSSHFVKKFGYPVNWRAVSQNKSLTDEFCYEFVNVIYWQYVVKNENVTEECLIRNAMNFISVTWLAILRRQNLSKSFIMKYLWQIDSCLNDWHHNDWHNVVKWAPPDLIEEYKEQINFRGWTKFTLRCYYNKREDLIRRFQHNINWKVIFNSPDEEYFSKGFRLEFAYKDRFEAVIYDVPLRMRNAWQFTSNHVHSTEWVEYCTKKLALLQEALSEIKQVHNKKKRNRRNH